MTSPGYTLAEVLAALLVVSLATAGLAEGARAIRRAGASATTATAEGRDLRRARAALASLAAAAPAAGAGLNGDAAGFQATCGEGEACAARLGGSEAAPRLEIARGGPARSFPLPAGGKLRLVYDARDGRYDRWPPEGDPSGAPRPLEAIVLVRSSVQGDASLAVARLWTEHPAICEFDAIAGRCRSASP